MRCANCGIENPQGLKFCNQCGSPLKARCAKCGFDNAPGAKFCGECGAVLAGGAAPATGAAAIIAAAASRISVTAEPAAGDIPEGERKTVTALFADIKGSTELMADLDPEVARAIVDPALRLMIDAVRRYDGYIVQSTGDGIFALFGAPVAHEDHPQRALYTGLRMQEDLRRYGEKLQGEGRAPIEIRVGVNTGEVVVRSIATGAAHAEYTPIGHTANLAARLQALARTGSVVVSENTRRLVEGYFQLKALTPAQLKGISEPVGVFEVTGLGSLRTRLQVAAQRGLTKFVGREAELAQMRRALESARKGNGQIVAAMGEPGVGKSRLFFEFKAVAQSGCLVLDAYSVSHGKATAYLPVIELLRDYFRITAEDDSRLRREKVIGKVLGLDRTLEDTLPYVFGLLGIQAGDDPLAQMDAQIRRRRTQEALKRILLRESLNQPLILVFEDLHWIDGETQGLLNLLADSIANARILLTVNYRPEYRHEWGHRTHYTQVRLDPLGSESAEEMLTALLTSPAPAAEAAGANRERSLVRNEAEDARVRVQDSIEELKRFIIARTQGNPFFIEEIVQGLFDEGVLVRNGAIKVTRALSQVHLPPTVQGMLAARIDRLPAAEKDLLLTLAVLGREFPLGLIAGVTQMPGPELERMLANLQLGEFIYEQPAFPEAEYRFKHALTQEVAYNSVLLARRKLLHGRAGAAIESVYAARLEDHLDELAHHYGRSDNAAKAIEYLGRAAAQALNRSHYGEARDHGAAALELLYKLPKGPERLQAELGLQMLIARASMHTSVGFNAPEVERALSRAESICREIGNPAQLFSTLGDLRIHDLGFGNYRRTRELAREMVEIAEKQGSKELMAEAYFHWGDSLWVGGQFREALTYLERAIAMGQPGQKFAADIDALVMALNRAAPALWILGYADQALDACRRSAEHAAAIKHPASIVVAQFTFCVVRRLRRDRNAVNEAETLATLANEHGFSYYEEGTAVLERSLTTRAPAELLRLVELARQTGLKLFLIDVLAALAEAYGRMGDSGRGLDHISDAFAEMEDSSKGSAEAELHRIKGELLLVQDASNAEQARQFLHKAIEVARRQEAKFYELRATMGLARLLAKQGRRDEAHAMLADIYAWFTEGFDTTDLKEARALLDQLAG